MRVPCTLTLPDGRTVAYDDIGDPHGEVVLYLHGAPDCRLARHPDDRIAAGAGIRLLAVDRPGYGRSDLPAGPTFESAARALSGFLDTLGVARCRVLAWSAGAPYALALATVAGPARISAVTTFGGMVPAEAYLDAEVVAASRARAQFVTPVLEGRISAAAMAAEGAQHMLPPPPLTDELAAEVVEELLSPFARTEIDQVPGLLELLGCSLAESVAVHATAGFECDIATQLGDRAEVVLSAPCPVRVIHGAQDRVAGAGVGQWLVDRLADARLEVWADAGHHGLFARWDELLR